MRSWVVPATVSSMTLPAGEDWRKSSYSAYHGNCLEWRFRKSSYSNHSNCAEVALSHGTVQVRDSRAPAGPVLEFTPAQWEAFTEGIKAGAQS